MRDARQKHEALKAFCSAVQARTGRRCCPTQASADDACSHQGTLAWDSLHYLRVSQCGYETEKSHAFFPLLPALMRGVQATRESPSSPPLKRPL